MTNFYQVYETNKAQLPVPLLVQIHERRVDVVGRDEARPRGRPPDRLLDALAHLGARVQRAQPFLLLDAV